MQEIKYSRLYKDYKRNQFIQQSPLTFIILLVLSIIITIIPCIYLYNSHFSENNFTILVIIEIFLGAFSSFFFSVIFVKLLPKKYTIICENFSDYKKFRRRQWEEEQKKWLW